MNFLTNVEKLLDLPPIKKTQVIKELKSHYLDIEEELNSSGKSPDQIDSEIQMRLGSPKDIAARMNAVHNSASWKSALIAILPFLGMLGSLLKTHQEKTSYIGVSIYVIFFLVIFVGSIRELIIGRRPIWLATWLAGAYYYGSVMFNLICFQFFDVETLGSMHYVFSSITTLTYMYGASKVCRWKISNMIIGIAQIVISIGVNNFAQTHLASGMMQILALVGYLLGIMLVLRFALAVFALNDYGSASQSLLFVLATTISYQHVFNTYSAIGLIAAISIAVAIYTRMAEWKSKLLVIAISFIPICILKSFANLYYYASSSHPNNLFLSYLISSILSMLVTIIPLVIYENLRRNKPRKILDSMISI